MANLISELIFEIKASLGNLIYLNENNKKLFYFPVIFLRDFWRKLRYGKKGEVLEVIKIKGKNYLFLAIPKNANTSIKKEIYSYNNPFKDYSKLRFEEFHNISRYSLHRNELEKIKEKSFIFCFVRNPYDRILSAYRDFVTKSGDRNEKYLFVGDLKKINFNLTFKEFVRLVCSVPDWKTDRHFQSQSFFIKLNLGKTIPNFIGKVENIKKDWKKIHSLIGLRGEIGKVHSSKKEKNKNPYTSELKNLVYQRYKEDFLRFNYSR